jgi:hypothetical protein
MVEHVLEVAETWPGWSPGELEPDPGIFTPHKAIRRVTDHLIDHLAEVVARLDGIETIPDRWHASSVTTSADMAPFGAADLDEARSRLSRLALMWSLLLDGLTPAQLDDSPGEGWTFRQIAFHVAESDYYADAVV